MHIHTHTHTLIRILANPIKPKARTPKYKRGEKRARWINSIQPRGTTKKEGGEKKRWRSRGKPHRRRGRRHRGIKTRVTRFVMEVLAPSKKKPREGGRGGNPPRGWLERRVSTDRIKGVRPTGEPSSGKSSMERSIIQICRNVQ